MAVKKIIEKIKDAVKPKVVVEKEIKVTKSKEECSN